MPTQTTLGDYDNLVTDGGTQTFDPDDETVTDAFEGAFIYTSWGYNQTNVNFAQIIDVSDSGKTVLARMVEPERVRTETGSNRLRPTANQYGEEFRLHVRNSGGDPWFRGSYPYIDGEKANGTRKGSFGTFGNDPEHTVHETPHGYRH